MQFVGLLCAVCNDRIMTALDGAGCSKCNLAYHQACLSKPKRCKSCGSKLVFHQNHVEEDTRREDIRQREVKHGGEMFWTLVVASVGFEVLIAVLRQFASPDPIHGVQQAVRLGLLLALLYFAHAGKKWASGILAVLSFLGGIGFAYLTYKAGVRADPMTVLVCGAMAGIYFFGSWVLGLSKRVRAYLDQNAIRRRG